MLSKKSHNIINVISLISVSGVCVVSMALIIILSVFNGFEALVVDMFNSFNPDIQITVCQGKTFDEKIVDKIKSIAGIKAITKVVEENALVKYNSRQCIAMIKGVSSDISQTSKLKNKLVDGDFRLEEGEQNYAIVGQGVAYYLNLRLSEYTEPLNIYMPNREHIVSLDPTKAFCNELIQPSGVFSIQQDFDSKYVMVPLRFIRKLMNYQNELTSLEIALQPEANVDKVKEDIRNVLGKNYLVKDKFQQQELLYKIMKTEKWAVFFILTFILIIATTAIIGSLTMLIVEKKKDIAVFMSLGASNNLIRRIFISEGLLIVILGALVGLILGFLICLLQMKFGLVKLSSEGSFLIDAYPVKFKIVDFVMTILAVLIVGIIAIWLPVSRISEKYLHQQKL